MAAIPITVRAPSTGLYRRMVVIDAPPTCELTPAEARELAGYLHRAAAVAEARR